MTNNNKQRPLKTLRSPNGKGIVVNIWENFNQKTGDRFFSISLSLSYFNRATSEWTQKKTLYASEAEKLIPLLQDAVAFIMAEEEMDGTGPKTREVKEVCLQEIDDDDFSTPLT